MRIPTVLLALCTTITLALATGCEPGPPDDQTTGDADGDATVAVPDTNPAARVEGTGQTGAGATTPDDAGQLQVATAGGPGPYLANSAGSALYFMEGDTDGSGCVNACTQAWPPVLVGEVAPTVGPELQAGMLGRITRADGSVQVTYNQHPLYRYAADTGAGRTAGHGVEDQWGQWRLIGPGGDALEPVQQ